MNFTYQWRPSGRPVLALVVVVLAAAATLIGASSARAICNPDYADCESPLTSTSDPDSGLHEVTRTPSGVHVRGYAIDPDTRGPIDAMVLIDGAEAGTVTADKFYWSNVLRLVFPNHGDYHGFDAVVPARAGSQLCVEPIDFDTNGFPADPPSAGHQSCLSHAIGLDPVGEFESISPAGPNVQLTGWALDPDTAGAINVNVYQDDAFINQASTSVQRPEVIPSGFVGYGAARGFSMQVPRLPGRHKICVYASNEGPGATNPLLGCKEYGPPIAPVVAVNMKSDTQLRIMWKDMADDEDGYMVTEVRPDGTYRVHATVAPVPGAGTWWGVDDWDLAPDTQYCYRVEAWNAYGRSSDQACNKTSPAPGPSIRRFSAVPNEIQVCVTAQVRLVWDVSRASRIEIFRGTTQIAQLKPPVGTTSWQGTFDDPMPQDGDAEYRLVAYDAAGRAAATDKALVFATSAFPLASSLTVRNDTNETLTVARYDAYDNPIRELGKVAPGTQSNFPFPHCEYVRVKVLDARGNWIYDGSFVGHNNGPEQLASLP